MALDLFYCYQCFIIFMRLQNLLKDKKKIKKKKLNEKRNQPYNKGVSLSLLNKKFVVGLEEY